MSSSSFITKKQLDQAVIDQIESVVNKELHDVMCELKKELSDAGHTPQQIGKLLTKAEKPMRRKFLDRYIKLAEEVLNEVAAENNLGHMQITITPK